MVGLFSTGYYAIGNYGTLNISAPLAAMFGVAGFVEMLVVGTVIGAVYKPAGGAKAGY